jgi:hypothetical protein
MRALARAQHHGRRKIILSDGDNKIPTNLDNSLRNRYQDFHTGDVVKITKAAVFSLNPDRAHMSNAERKKSHVAFLMISELELVGIAKAETAFEEAPVLEREDLLATTAAAPLASVPEPART